LRHNSLRRSKPQPMKMPKTYKSIETLWWKALQVISASARIPKSMNTHAIVTTEGGSVAGL
jgi:hypothetical protein